MYRTQTVAQPPSAVRKQTQVRYSRGRLCHIVVAGMLFGLHGVTAHAEPPSKDYQLIWADEFDGAKLNTDIWSEHQPGKRRDAINTPDAITLDGEGHLVIRTWTEQHGDKLVHKTGIVQTRGKFEHTYGYWEARIKFNDSPGEWSAFWLMTPTMGNPIDDPQKAGTEIDIVEHRAVDKSGHDIAGCAQHTLHWNGYGKEHKSEGTLVKNLGLRKGFHVYGLQWTADGYRFYIDDKLTWQTKIAPASHRSEYIILSSEVQNHSWAGDIPADGYGDFNTTKTRMAVDYVRVYDHKPKEN